MSDIFHGKFKFEDRMCRVVGFFPKKCSCGDCEKDFSYCDVVFLDDNEFRRHINFDKLVNITNHTDSKISHEEMQETPAVSSKEST